MFDLILVLSSISLLFTLFGLWQTKNRQSSSTCGQRSVTNGNPISADICKSGNGSRQSRRFQQCSLFGIADSFVCSAEIDGFSSAANSAFQSFVDRFKSLGDVVRGLQASGFEKCDLILGVDFTASNEWQGRRTFHHNSLHATLLRGSNPYQVIKILGSTLEPFSDDGSVFAFGFGDQNTKSDQVFSFSGDNGKPCSGFSDVSSRYNAFVKQLTLSGPTCYAPLLKKAMEIVKRKNRYHVLIIISDGQMVNQQETVQALLDASSYPLSIIMVGVGDGPWDIMEEFDDFLPQRKFDNFQFVDFHKAIESKRNAEATFALHALMEIPDQFKAIKKLGLLS